MELKSYLDKIKPADKKIIDACGYRWDNIAKPIGGLGELESLIIKIAGAQGTDYIDISSKAVLVMCADNGVIAQGVTQTDSSVTAIMSEQIAAGGASVNAMAKTANARVMAIDVGIKDETKYDYLINKRIANGTGDITSGRAMSAEQTLSAIEVGIEAVRELKAQGVKIIATGEMGIGNTTTSGAMAAALLGVSPELTVGRGAGLDSETLARKRAVVEKALELHKPDKDKPLEILSMLGGFDIAALTGAFIGGALNGVPMIIDGVISAVAALCAVKMNPHIKDYILASHLGSEAACSLIFRELEMEPVITAKMRLGEGTGAVALFPILDMAAAVYLQGSTFKDVDVSKYERLS